MNKSEKCKR